MNHKSGFNNHQRIKNHQIKDQQLKAGYWSNRIAMSTTAWSNGPNENAWPVVALMA